MLTTLASLKLWLGIPASNTSSDQLLDKMIQAASAFVEEWLDRTILSAAHVELRDGNGARRMKLANTPCTAVALVKVNGREIPSTEYTFRATDIILTGSVFYEGIANVELNYTAGYATVPADIEQTVNEMIGLRYKEKDRQGVTSKSMAGESISFSDKDMSASNKSVLTQRRRVIPV